MVIDEMIMAEVQNLPIDKRCEFVDMVESGTSPKLALMFVSQTPPDCRSNTKFMAHFGANGKQFENSRRGDAYEKVAKKLGFNTKGKVYISGLARFPGDPQAWISDRDDIKRICEKNNYNCEGEFNITARNDVPPKPPVDLAPQLVEQGVRDLLQEDPGLKSKPVEELRERVIEERSMGRRMRKAAKYRKTKPLGAKA